MLRKLRPRLSFANVTSLLALFVALGGTAYAAATITGADVVDDSLTGADIKGKPSPGFVDGSLDTYDIRNKSLLSSDVATNTLTAGELGSNSVSISEIKDGAVTKAKLAPLGAWSSSPLAFHHCAFTNPDFVNWSSFGSGYADVGVRLDAYGVVHLRGAAACNAAQGTILADETIATLGTGYRPKSKEVFSVASSDGSGNYVGEAIIQVDSGGNVTVGGTFDSRFISLSGIEFDTLN